MKKLGKSFWVFIGIASVFFLIMIILSAVLNLGDRISSVHPYVEYAFYGLSGLLFLILFVRPLLIVIFSPSFSMDHLFTDEQNAKKNYRMYKKVSKNLLKEDYLSNEEKEMLEESMNDSILLKGTLSEIFDKTIKKELNKMIIEHAETVYLSTAISQNGRLDALAVITINLKLIKALVQKCGFRPSYMSLGRLSLNVLSTAIIAENLEDMDFSEVFPSSTINALQEMPLVKTITGSFAQGLGNALLSLRVGIICRNYLFMDLKGLDRKQIRKIAFGEAVILLPRVIAESMKKLPSRLKGIFNKIF
ncbi:YcjF family protein [Mycoplasmatota bacterium]|nr:YcjF family protein [Mycoplasmatota bacterium]